MQSEKILEMLMDGNIEELKVKLQDEIYAKSLGSDGKKRYSAMKRYIKNTDSANELMQKPCINVHIREFGEDNLTCFIDGYCIAATKELPGDMEVYDANDKDVEYFKVDSMISTTGLKQISLNTNALLARAKAKGYKFKKSEFNNWDFKYVCKIGDAYLKTALLDKAYSIIDDGNVPEVYVGKWNQPVLFKTSIGISIVLPMKFDEEKNTTKVVIL